MCGIVGIIYTDSQKSVNEADLKLAADAIRHRGPDDEGYYLKGNVGLGFRRLSIIDLSTGHQPLCNEDKSIWIIFNGEIYNYQILRSELLQKGHQFSTNTDTETIVHLYEEYGVNCLNYLRGMFAFSIWDSRKQQLFCARDRFGKKPFYYANNNNCFIWASELKSIFATKLINKNLDLQSLDCYFSYGYTPSEDSIFKEVHKLPPAHYLIYSSEKNTLEVNRYWDIRFEPDLSINEQEWLERLEHELINAVKLRMISDVPLGAFLSGGIDSSLVVAIMSQLSATPVKTFSIGFNEEYYNELPYSRQVAKKYSTEHQEEIVNIDFIDLLPKLVDAYDEPFADSSAVPTYYVSKFARSYVTVALSGDGGDELFAGYHHYRWYQNIIKAGNPFKYFPKPLLKSISRYYPDRFPGKGILRKNAFETYELGANATLWTRDERERLYNKDFKNQLNYTWEEKRTEYSLQISEKDFISRLQMLDMIYYLPEDILTKVDRASMLCSLEVRVPLLDHKLAELTFQMPSNLKLKGNIGKYLLKQLARKYLPNEVLSHPKHGFGLPIRTWFNKELQQYVNDRLLNSSAKIYNLIDPKYISGIIRIQNDGFRNVASKIWSLLFLEEWLEQNKL